MSYIQKVSSVLNDHIFGITGNETSVQKYTKLVVGLGIAGLAALSWKVTVTAGLFYSAYKGGEIAYNRFFQKREIKREPAASNAVLNDIDIPLIVPVNGSHDAHGGGQREEPAPLLRPKEAPLNGVENLKALQKEWIAKPQVKNREKMGLVFKAMISHPEAVLMGTQLHWIREKSVQYGKNSTWKLKWLIFKHKFQCYEKPKEEASK